MFLNVQNRVNSCKISYKSTKNCDNKQNEIMHLCYGMYRINAYVYYKQNETVYMCYDTYRINEYIYAWIRYVP